MLSGGLGSCVGHAGLEDRCVGVLDWGLGRYPLKDTIAVMVSEMWADMTSGRLGRCVEHTG